MMLDENVMRGKAADFTETTMSGSIHQEVAKISTISATRDIFITDATNKLE